MSPIDRLNQWLAPAAGLNPNGTAAFEWDGHELIVAVDAASPFIMLFAELRDLTGLGPNESARLVACGLRMNHRFAASVSLDDDHGRMVCHRTLAWRDLSEAAFRHNLEHFADEVGRLHAALSRDPNPQPLASSNHQDVVPTTPMLAGAAYHGLWV